jgi:hypothetical protein
MAAVIITTGNRSTWKTQSRIKLTGRDDATLLPDTTLEAFVDEAEREIKDKLAAGGISNYATLTGDDKERMIDAAIACNCSKLVRPLRAVMAKIEKTKDMQDTYDIDFDAMQADLTAQVEMYLSEITTYSTSMVVTRAGVICDTSPYESLL